jgi:Trk-type K+ transport system membrane component
LGLYDDSYRFNYFLQIILILTFVFGGLGFPIVANILSYLKYRLSTLFSSGRRLLVYKPWVLSLNSRITLITTFSITAVSFLIFYVLEYNNTLHEHNGFGKIITALFGATTPRTAGFNTLDNASMEPATMLVVILLMWIGASPQSTGGGIKTSTFVLILLSVITTIRGKKSLELGGRSISFDLLNKAYTIFIFSATYILVGTFFLAYFEPKMSVLDLVFEQVSAFCTVGLTRGITPDLSTPGKLILISSMYVGRVGTLTLAFALASRVDSTNYRYPKAHILVG